ncbi:MAG: type II toxin-antitoxin system PemK/MazF family toxin [Planctomycetota bacterium]|nr:type II toxin-antitoxin system PemK/MazF family toxin [Planctomycetota bacterium]
MNRGSVWWTDFEPATGGEIKKTRPAVIVSNDRANATLNRVVVAPFTSNVKRIYPGNAIISLMGKNGKVLADQIRTVDKQRLRSKICELAPYDMQKINTAIRLHLAL